MPKGEFMIPAGKNIGESLPTGVFGQSGYAFNGDGTVDFWSVVDEGGTFAVGAQSSLPPGMVPSVCGLGMLPAMMAICTGLLLMPRRVGSQRGRAKR